MPHSLFVSIAAILLVVQPTSDPEFLEKVRVVETHPSAGELTLMDPQGASRRLKVGDLVEEAGGARVKQVGRSTLVFTREVSGGDGQKGEALIVVRFDRSGKTRVREYRTVPDVSSKTPPSPDAR